jgi:hypothetical protein
VPLGTARVLRAPPPANAGAGSSRGHRCSIMRPGDMTCADATRPCRAFSWCLAQVRSQREFRVSRWWRLWLASTEVVLAAGLIVAAVTEGG